jgi:hypothetical protein
MALKKIPYRDWGSASRDAFEGASDKSVMFENDGGEQAVVGPAEAFDGELFDVYLVEADLRCLTSTMTEAEIIVEKFLGT